MKLVPMAAASSKSTCWCSQALETVKDINEKIQGFIKNVSCVVNVVAKRQGKVEKEETQQRQDREKHRVPTQPNYEAGEASRAVGGWLQIFSVESFTNSIKLPDDIFTSIGDTIFQ